MTDASRATAPPLRTDDDVARRIPDLVGRAARDDTLRWSATWYEAGELDAVAKPQSECFAAGVLFARTEGIVPAPEPTHALAAVIDEARRCTETGEEKVILTALCGHGHLDLAACTPRTSRARSPTTSGATPTPRPH